MRVHSEYGRGRWSYAVTWVAMGPWTTHPSPMSHCHSEQPQPRIRSASGVQQMRTCGDGVVWGDSHGECYVNICNRKENRSLLCEI